MCLLYENIITEEKKTITPTIPVFSFYPPFPVPSGQFNRLKQLPVDPGRRLGAAQSR